MVLVPRRQPLCRRAAEHPSHEQRALYRALLGAGDYVIRSLPAHKRFFLRFVGIHGHKKVGIDELRQTAEKGLYLRPYAKMLLGLVALREMQIEVARKQFTD